MKIFFCSPDLSFRPVSAHGRCLFTAVAIVHVFYTSVAFSINYAVSALAIQLCTKYMYYTLTLCIYIIITLHG